MRQQTMEEQQMNRICIKDATFPKPSCNFRMNLSGIRSKASQLHRALFRIAVYFGINGNNFQTPIVFVVTASHNPFLDNGLKIGSAGEQIIQNSVFKQIQQFINISEPLESNHLLSIAKKTQRQPQSLEIYLGRDKRVTSYELSQIITQEIHHYPHLRLINFGEISTPQIFAIASKVKNGSLQSNQPNKLKKLFNNEILDAFGSASNLLGFKQKKKICIDFGNGIGAVSYQSYREFLDKYFEISIINNCDFQRVNYKCGPQYVSHLCFPNLPKMQDFEQRFYFDGDCDRIIMQIDENNLLNGDNMNAIIAITLKKLIDGINLSNLNFGVVSDVNVNEGLSKLIKSMNIHHVKAQVGVINLYKKVKQFDIGCYFESTGHGAIYVKDHVIQTVKSVQNQTIHHHLLVDLAILSSNSCKGYALHNLMIIQLCEQYLNIRGPQLYLFQKNYEMGQSVCSSRFSEYKTDQSGENLIQPIDIVNKINKLKSKYENDCYIIVRVSNTENKIRLGIQGKKQTVVEVMDLIKQIILNDK